MSYMHSDGVQPRDSTALLPAVLDEASQSLELHEAAVQESNRTLMSPRGSESSEGHIVRLPIH